MAAWRPDDEEERPLLGPLPRQIELDILSGVHSQIHDLDSECNSAPENIKKEKVNG